MRGIRRRARSRSPTTTGATITTRGSTAAHRYHPRTDDAAVFGAPVNHGPHVTSTRPSTAVTPTTDRTTQTRPSTVLQSPINRTVTVRTTEYRQESGQCGNWGAWSTTAPSTAFCSDPNSEGGVRVALIETRQSACPSGSSADPNNSNQCLSNCPSGTTASGTQCVYSCGSGSTLIGGRATAVARPVTRPIRAIRRSASPIAPVVRHPRQRSVSAPAQAVPT
jgi:hypothetical protein